jgi:hypothetical protein
MKTVSRVYDSYGQAREAVRAVEAAGVPSSEVSLIANKHVSAAHADVNEVSDTAKGAGIGGALGGGAGLLAGLGLLAMVSPASRSAFSRTVMRRATLHCSSRPRLAMSRGSS